MAGQAYRVTCHTPDDSDPDRRLQGVGGTGIKGTEGEPWWLPIDDAISGIEAGLFELWTVDQKGNSVWVLVDQRNGRKYLRTESDGVEPNNLLALNPCP